jgi:glucose/arabinose dehydrogenase
MHLSANPTWFLVATLAIGAETLEGQETAPTNQIQLELVSSDLDDPVGLAHAGDGSERLFVVERAGRIRSIDTNTSVASAFLDIATSTLAQEMEEAAGTLSGTDKTVKRSSAPCCD